MKKTLGRLSMIVLVVCLLSGLVGVAVFAKGAAAPAQATTQAYTFKAVRTGGGGGYIVDILFHPKQQNLIYAKTDMGGAYRWDQTSGAWIQLLDWLGAADWNWTGVEGMAIDPSNVNNLYLAVGTYTNSWAGTNGAIMRSSDKGATFTRTDMPFKMGGNMPGRGMGERLAVDPNKGSIIYFGARSGKGLWKSTDSGVTFTQVANFPDTGPYVENPSDGYGYANDPVGVVWITFDPSTGTAGNASQTIYVGVAQNGPNKPNIFRSTDGGATWAAIPGEVTCNGAYYGSATCTDGNTWTTGTNTGTGAGIGYLPEQGKLDASGTLYVTYSDWDGPYGGTTGAVFKYVPSTNLWTNITPATAANNYLGILGTVENTKPYFGYGGLALDTLHPGTLMVSGQISWYPDNVLFRSTDYGATWTTAWKNSDSPTNLLYTMDVTNAPWLDFANSNPDPLHPKVKLGWMMQGMNIDPFNSDRMMYGTGATLFETQNLTKWGSGTLVTIKSQAVGIEEGSVKGLVSPSSGTAHLYSVYGDITGFRHDSLDSAPSSMFTQPQDNYALDFAESNPNYIVRIGKGDATKTPPTTGSAFSSDGGVTWTAAATDIIAGQGEGSVAMAADGSRVVWAPSTAAVSYTSDKGATWHASASIPQGAMVASDRVNKNKFYGVGNSKFWVSTDGGATFTATAAANVPGNLTAFNAVFGREGDIWMASGGGLWHTTDGGATITQLATVWGANRLGIGAPAVTGAYPALYISGMPANTSATAMFRSDDMGATWIQITDGKHLYGTIQCMAADPRVYGRIYFGTNGFGAVYGDIAGTVTTPTVTPTGSTNTPTRTNTPPITNTASPTFSTSPTRTNTPGITNTSTRTSTVGITNTPTRTSTAGPTSTPTRTFTPGPTVTRTLTPTITPTANSACSPVTSTIAAPFTYDGAGAFCWQSSNLGAYVNSWNTTSVTINGVNVTNLYMAAGSYPAKVGAYWYVSYSSAVSYGHFEAK